MTVQVATNHQGTQGVFGDVDGRRCPMVEKGVNDLVACDLGAAGRPASHLSLDLRRRFRLEVVERATHDGIVGLHVGDRLMWVRARAPRRSLMDRARATDTVRRRSTRIGAAGGNAGGTRRGNDRTGAGVDDGTGWMGVTDCCALRIVLEQPR